VAARAREGLKFEKVFLDASAVLIAHLKGRPECRDLMNEIMAPAPAEGENAPNTTTPGRVDGV
jgi:eukaryotic-like serine/threonine-protein kinase